MRSEDFLTEREKRANLLREGYEDVKQKVIPMPYTKWKKSKSQENGRKDSNSFDKINSYDPFDSRGVKYGS